MPPKQKKKDRLIAMQGPGELLVFLESKKDEVIRDYFGPATGRNQEDYDEAVMVTGIVRISSHIEME